MFSAMAIWRTIRLLRLEPRGQRDGIALAPDAYGSRCIAQRDDEPDRAVQFIGGALDDIFRRGRPGSRLRLPDRRQRSYRPFAETCEAGDEFVAKSIDEVTPVLGTPLASKAQTEMNSRVGAGGRCAASCRAGASGALRVFAQARHLLDPTIKACVSPDGSMS